MEPSDSTAATIDWHVVPFSELSPERLYALLRLRSDVFVVEQACVFLDPDGLDAQATHLLGVGADGTLLAYARLFAPGVTFPEASIGRVVTDRSARGGGLGHRLMERAIEAVGQCYGRVPVRIGAQSHLQAFYGRHGFVSTGHAYVEDGIPHVHMLRSPT